MVSEKSRNRIPSPPQNRTTFIAPPPFARRCFPGIRLLRSPGRAPEERAESIPSVRTATSSAGLAVRRAQEPRACEGLRGLPHVRERQACPVRDVEQRVLAVAEVQH